MKHVSCWSHFSCWTTLFGLLMASAFSCLARPDDSDSLTEVEVEGGVSFVGKDVEPVFLLEAWPETPYQKPIFKLFKTKREGFFFFFPKMGALHPSVYSLDFDLVWPRLKTRKFKWQITLHPSPPFLLQVGGAAVSADAADAAGAAGRSIVHGPRTSACAAAPGCEVRGGFVAVFLLGTCGPFVGFFQKFWNVFGAWQRLLVHLWSWAVYKKVAALCFSTHSLHAKTQSHEAFGVESSMRKRPSC